MIVGLMRALTTLALLLLPSVSPGQSNYTQRKPTFQAGVEVISLSLSVTDGRNRLITGLSEPDFAVFEDGIRQDLAFFTQDALPLSVSLPSYCGRNAAQCRIFRA